MLKFTPWDSLVPSKVKSAVKHPRLGRGSAADKVPGAAQKSKQTLPRKGGLQMSNFILAVVDTNKRPLAPIHPGMARR